jgi:hypothetical protein
MRGVFRVEPIDDERQEFELFPRDEEGESELAEEAEEDEEEEYEEDDAEDGFLLDREDRKIVRGLKKVLWQLARSAMLSSARQLEAVARVLSFLEDMPRAGREDDIEINLRGRRRKFKNGVEIFRYWTIRIEGQVVEVTSAGSYFNPATGGDSFTSQYWCVEPGCDPMFSDYRDDLWMVPYLGDLADELAEMNLKKDGVEVEIIVCCEKIE